MVPDDVFYGLCRRTSRFEFLEVFHIKADELLYMTHAGLVLL